MTAKSTTDPATGLRRCSACRQSLPLDAFGRNGRYLRSRCDPCARAVAAAWYREHRAERLERLRAARH